MQQQPTDSYCYFYHPATACTLQGFMLNFQMLSIPFLDDSHYKKRNKRRNGCLFTVGYIKQALVHLLYHYLLSTYYMKTTH